MKSKPLEIVERIVRNLPILKPAFLEFDSNLGKIYIGLGEDGHGVYHGAWAFTRGGGIARTMEFKKNQSRQACINTLKLDAYGTMEAMNEKGLLADGIRYAG